MSALAQRWSQIPPLPEEAAEGGDRSPAIATAWLITAAGPVLASLSASGLVRAGAMALAALPAVAAALRVREDAAEPAPALAGAAVAGLLAAVLGGLSLGIWTAASGLVALWVVGRPEAAGRWRPGPDVAGPTAGLAAAAAVLGLGTTTAHPGWAALWVLPVAAVAALLTLRPSAAAKARTIVDRVAKVLAAVVATVVGALVAVVTVVLPWLVQRIVRWDPLWVPRPKGTRWVARAPGGGTGTDMGARDPRLVRSSAGRRLQRIPLVLVPLLAILVVLGSVGYVMGERADDDRYDVPALADAPWSRQLGDAMAIAYGRGQVTAFLGPVMPDVRSPYLNIEDGVRRTWRPSAATCRPVRVWMLGGSAMFGEGQRDDHTIASELAKQAWKEGIALDITNLGVGGDTHWMEVRRLEVALAERRPKPDLVVFYDGANDWRTQSYLNGTGKGGSLLFPNDLDSNVLRDVTNKSHRTAGLLDLTRVGPTVITAPDRVLDADEVADAAARSFALSGKTGNLLLDAASIPRLWFAQPARPTRTPANPDDYGHGPEDESYPAQIDRRFRSKLPSDVVDLGGTFDDVDQPIYWDQVHTNELGARLVAKAMWPKVRSSLPAEAKEASCR